MQARRRLLVQPNRRRQTAEGADRRPAGEEQGRRGAGADEGDETMEELPPYEPLALPLNDAAVNKVAEVANGRALTRAYDSHLKASAQLLRHAVYDINDHLNQRKAELQGWEERRKARRNGGGEEEEEEPMTRAEAATQKVVRGLSEEVPAATSEMEQQARLLIDMQVALEDEQSALRETADKMEQRRLEDRTRRQLREQWKRQRQEEKEQRQRQGGGTAAEGGAGSQRKRKRHGDTKKPTEFAGDDDGDDEEEADEGDGAEEDDKANSESDMDEELRDPPALSVVEVLEEARQTRAAAYAGMDVYRRYGLNNDYITFKRMWHDGLYPGNDVALPDANAWFDAAGQPRAYGPDTVLGGHSRRAAAAAEGEGADAAAAAAEHADGEGEGDSGEDDLIVAREIISFKCPLLLTTMKDPYKSRVCNHTFEKAGIVEYLQGDGPKQCPQTGCSLMLQLSDLVPDEVMRRRIERAELLDRRQREAAAALDLEEEEDYEGESEVGRASLVVSNVRNVKAERMRR